MNTVNTITPWYRQFWPWFIIALPACVVVASIITVVIAIKHEDSLVADNYYKDGLAINQELARDQAAARLALHANATIDWLVGELQIAVDGHSVSRWPATLTMLWFHPTNKQQDFSIVVQRTANQHYLGQLPDRITGRWYVQLSAAEPEPWRLKSTVIIDHDLRGNTGSSDQFAFEFSSADLSSAERSSVE